MIITNGQILLMLILCLVFAIKSYIRRKNRYSYFQLHNIKSQANQNRYKARYISDEFYFAMEYFQILSLQKWEKGDQKFIQDLTKLCRGLLCDADEIEYEWKFIVDYIDKGLCFMGCNDYGNPSINIRKKFKKNYKRSVKIARHLQLVKRVEQILKDNYGYLFLLPEQEIHCKGGDL